MKRALIVLGLVASACGVDDQDTRGLRSAAGAVIVAAKESTAPQTPTLTPGEFEVLPPGPCEQRSPGTITIASGQNNPFMVRADKDLVYWADEENGGSVVSWRKRDGNPISTLASGQAFPWMLALTDTSVVWVDDGTPGSVRSIPKDGGDQTVIAPMESLANGIAVDSENAYWTDFAGSVVMAPLIGGGTPTTLVKNSSGAFGIAVDSDAVYWTTGTVPGTLSRYVFADGSVQKLGVGNHLNSVVVDLENAYWVSADDGTVLSVPRGGGTTSTLATKQEGPQDLAVGPENLYWANSGGSIVKVAVTGGNPETLATGEGSPRGIAIDACSIYWTDTSSGTVRRLTPK